MTPTTAATLLGTATTGVYALLCWVKPFGPCRWCKRTGTRTTLILRRPAACRMCSGSRLRLRLGRRAYNTARTVIGTLRTGRTEDGAQ